MVLSGSTLESWLRMILSINARISRYLALIEHFHAHMRLDASLVINFYRIILTMS